MAREILVPLFPYCKTCCWQRVKIPRWRFYEACCFNRSGAMLKLAMGALCAVSATLSVAGYAQQAKTLNDGVYSAAQAARGQALFTANCAACHGPELKGAVGPMLTG